MDPIDRARAYITKCPPAVSGQKGHDQTYKVACSLVLEFGALMPGDAVWQVLTEYNQTGLPPFSLHDLEHKLRDAYSKVTPRPPIPVGIPSLLQSPILPATHTSSWPDRNDAWVKDRRSWETPWGKPLTAEMLRQCSPVSPPTTAEEAVDTLFPDNPLLCVGRSVKKFVTKPRGALRGRLNDDQFIVPNPMTKLTGLTQSGKESARCLENTGHRRFWVIEADFTPEDEELFNASTDDLCATVLFDLLTHLPMAAAVMSGGKSIHGWFYVHGADELILRKCMNYAVQLGADKATWTACQFVRMPAGTRDNGNHQQIIYWNPQSIAS